MNTDTIVVDGIPFEVEVERGYGFTTIRVPDTNMTTGCMEDDTQAFRKIHELLTESVAKVPVLREEAHTIQDMSELQAAHAIIEDINIIINEMLPEIKSAILYDEVSFGTLFDNIEEAAHRIIDLNHDEDCRLNPNK